ncbi:hypothetical protein OQA88_44 [Cercophora sp. LCS_1]
MDVATPVLTRFTPSPTCGIASPTHLYAVHKTCYIYGPSTVLINPPFITCTAIQAGEPPDKANRECYADWSPLSTGTYYSACPVGYSPVSTLSYHPFLRSSTQTATDVVARVVYCCPSTPPLVGDDGPGDGYDGPWGYAYEPAGESAKARQTVVDGVTYAGEAYLMPRCRGILGKGVRTLTGYSDTMGWEKRQERQVVTETWDVGREVWAAGESFSYTRFGDGHTCFGNCTGYWRESYTSPEVLVPEVTESPEETEGTAVVTGTGTGTGATRGTGTVAQTGSGSGSGPRETATSGVPKEVVRMGMMGAVMAAVLAAVV